MNMNGKSQKVRILGVVLTLIFAVTSFLYPVFNVKAGDDVDDVLDDIDKYEEKEEKLENELNTVQQSVNVTQVQISKTSGLIESAEESINRKEEEVYNLLEQNELQKKLLTKFLQEFYYMKRQPVISQALFKGDFSTVYGKADHVLTIEEKIVKTIEEIKENKKQLEEEKEEIEGEKEEHEQLLAVKTAQQQQLLKEKEATQLELGEVRTKLNKLRSALSSFLGSSYDLDDVVDAVKFADKVTGVRAEFIFAMLDKETDLGRFTGGCYYSKGKNPVKEHMKEADRDEFKDIMDELDYDKNDKKLSCWPGYGYGGAMGVAQFMPTTWRGYDDKIADLTGSKVANPWRLVDGVIGMALKLKAAGADSKKNEHYAAKVYYCGGPGSPYWSNKCEAYADTVVSWSKGYDEYFD